MFQGDVAGGHRGGVGDVDRALRRRRGAGEIEQHGLPGDREVEGDGERGVGDAVVVEHVVEAVGAVRQRADGVTHEGFGAIRQRTEGFSDGGVAILVEQAVQPTFAQRQGAKLALQVTPVRQRQARVGGQDVGDVGVHAAGGTQPDGRDAHAFLEAFGGLRVVAAGHVAADVEPVACRGDPAEQRAVAEERLHEAEIVEVGAAGIGVVEQEDVAGLGAAVACHLGDDGAHRESHGADEDRQARGALDERVAGGGVVQAVTGVAGFGDDRVERGAIQRRVHLVGDLGEPAVEDGEGDGIDHVAGAA